MKKFFVLIALMTAFVFAADMVPMSIPRSEINRYPVTDPINIEAQVVSRSVTSYPPWLENGRDAPWTDTVRIPDVYNRNDSLVSMAYGPDGKIYVAYDAISNANPLRYGTGVAWSIDNGATWDNVVYGSGTYSVNNNEIAVTNDGKIYIWGSLSGGAYTNIPCYMRSRIGLYNRPDTLYGWSGYNIPNRVYTECVTWGNGNQMVLIQYTVDRTGTANDSVFCLFSYDSTAYYGFSFRPSGGYPGMTSIGLDVSGTDTMVVHGIEYYDGTGADWDIVCYQDTFNGSGGLYGWGTTNANADRYPTVFQKQGYAYIAYQADVGSGNYDVMFNNSTDYGVSWGGIQDIANDARNETYPRVSAGGQAVGVDWVYNNARVQFKYSVDGGITWLSSPEYVDVNGSAFGAYHAVGLLYTSNYWYGAWLDTRNSAAAGVDIYTSKRAQGQGLITHRPDRMVFDYSTFQWRNPFSPDKYVLNREMIPIDDHLAETIDNSSADAKIPVFVMLSKQLNYDWFVPLCERMAKPERRQFMIRESRQLASEDQRSLLEYLAQREREGRVSDVVSLWITNTVSFKAVSEVIRDVANRNDVWCLGVDEKVEIIGDEGDHRLAPVPADKTGRELGWGVEKIGADHVWGMGYFGAGVVVGHMDTGVNYNHGDLHDHIWDGSPYGFPNHGYDFTGAHDDDPMDTDGHGTATAGIVAGDGTNGSQTGVAPNAQIMCLKCDGTGTDMAEAIQWGTTYGADLFSTSLGFSNPTSSTKNWGRGQANFIYGNGMVWCVAAGNGNPNPPPNHFPVPQDICTPADAPAPWYAPNGGNSSTIGVGATTLVDIVDTYSSYGPTSWNTGTYTDYTYPPGLMKPDVSAPGSNCKSLLYSNNTGYVVNLYGTSFAQPHVAGTVALMLSRNPALTPRQIDSLLQNTAVDIMAVGRDSLAGKGRIDAYQAVLSMAVGVKSGLLWVINQAAATGILQVTSITKALNKNWLIGVNPTAFNVPMNDSQGVWVTTDTTGKGLHYGDNVYDTLLIWSNTLSDDNPERVVVLLRYNGWIGAEEQYEVVINPQTVLLSITPNPFKSSTELAYVLPNKQKVNLAIYDASGRKVKTLFDGCQNPGEFSVLWTGNDDQGQPLAAGVYFGRFEFGGKVATNKLILTK